MRTIDDLLREAKEVGASDIHISTGRPPFFRVDGILKPVTDKPITESEAAEMIGQMMGSDVKNRATLETIRQVDFSYGIAEGVRFRVNVFYHLGRLSAALRLISSQIL